MDGGSTDLLMERRGAVMAVTLDRPNHRNAASGVMLRGLARAIEDAESAGCLVVRIDAAGEDFCVGRDHSESPRLGSTRWTADEWRRMTKDVFAALESFGGVVVVGVKGRAYGFGALLAGCADVTLAAESARLAFDEVPMGFAPRGVMSRLFNRLGERRMTELILTGRSVPAPEAAIIGIVTEVVGDDVLASRLDETVATIVRHDENIVRDAKVFLRKLSRMNPSDRVSLGLSDSLHS